MIRLLTRWACPRRALHFGWGQPLTHSWTPRRLRLWEHAKAGNLTPLMEAHRRLVERMLRDAYRGTP